MKLNARDKMLIEEAKKIILKSKRVKLIGTGDVGAALITSKGNIFTGVDLGFYCGIGSCGEYQAIGSMISNGENEIGSIVSLYYHAKTGKYRIIPPCGKCREMMWQASKRNRNAEVIISGTKKLRLRELLPHAWGGSLEK
jgi:cytidine deaminase